MNDKEFSELHLRVTILPTQARWPAATFLHWQSLHAVADEARERVSQAYALMDAIDRNANLSRDGKYRQLSETAAKAIANFEASETLTRAREAVELVLSKHTVERRVTSEINDEAAMIKAMKEAEQGWRTAINKIGARGGLRFG